MAKYVGVSLTHDFAITQAPSGEDDEILPDLDEIEGDNDWNPNGVLLTDNPADWPGHLKSFGSEGRYRNVGIYKNFPKPELFFSDNVAPYIPLVMRNASITNDAFGLWKNDSYFLGLPQAITYKMPLTPTANISFKEFIQRYRKEKLVFNDEVPFFLGLVLSLYHCLILMYSMIYTSFH